MRILVHQPETYDAERRYVLDVVLAEWLGLEYDVAHWTRRGVAIQLAGDPRGATLSLPDVFFATEREAWLTDKSLPVRPLARIGTAGIGDRSGSASPSPELPVIFGETNAQIGWQQNGAVLALPVDVFGSVFFLITRYEEIVRPTRDRHERFPAEASLAAAEGYLDRPLADEYVDLLWTAMHSLWPELSRRPTSFRLRLTHDVDEVSAVQGSPVKSVAHAVAGDIIRRRDPALAFRRARALVEWRIGMTGRDPFDSFDFLMETSERHGLRATFFFMSGGTRPEFDGHYGISDPAVKRLLRRIHDRGHELGLHASYDSYNSYEQLHAELEALKAACDAVGIDQPLGGVRQHYLRFENPITWRIQDAAGFQYDTTLGFPEQPGFRSGTCREHPLFDLLERRRLGLRERPLIVMDTTLSDYLTVGRNEALVRAQSVVDACRRHRGDAVLLHHNSLVASGRWRDHYIDLVQQFAASV